MSNVNRDELAAALAELSRYYPEWRFGQLIANVCGWADKEMWDVEDEELLSVARAHLEEINQRSNVARA